MMSEGSSSCTRPGGGSSCAVPGRCERDAIAPKCYCGVYAIMYKSRTTSNPNRVFFGCPLFKAKEPYCRYFVWLDEHFKKIRAVEPEALGAVDEAEGVAVVEQVLRNQDIEEKIEELERKLLSIEGKKLSLWHITVIGVVVVVIAVCMLKG
ncbi:uncharacterized protein At4g04775-like [Arachis ipaensis]|uniref:GRF-type domain-containing protein n=1 Tax=Arachis hypogaea TaxID=3818 RepID=A0A444Z3C8_ARAHY|nr:uncharacterized protein At4g04775-like [Arachis ipaensis]XP_025652812.1 uncharacterized protein At4g04775-like [Arachis hypogaea]RYR08675.1 hypothetical protein Ahy_B05g076475 [Arachis hypogaea]